MTRCQQPRRALALIQEKRLQSIMVDACREPLFLGNPANQAAKRAGGRLKVSI